MTHRLTDSPACLVADEHDVSGNLARILKAAGQKAPASKPILEINPQHPVVLRLKYEEKQFDDWAAVLFDQALLAEGGQLDDPADFRQAHEPADAGNERRLTLSGGRLARFRTTGPGAKPGPVFIFRPAGRRQIPSARCILTTSGAVQTVGCLVWQKSRCDTCR